MLRNGAQELDNYDRLMEQTRKKLKIIDGKEFVSFFLNVIFATFLK